MTMTNAELMKALIQKFIQVTLDDGSVHAGYIGNPEDFQGDSLPAHMVLINGLMRDNIEVARVVDVEFPKEKTQHRSQLLDLKTSRWKHLLF